MPLSAFDGPHGWGYDGVALDAVHEPYGGPDALCRFVDAAHDAGLAVVLDLVHNHLGPSGDYWDRFGPLGPARTARRGEPRSTSTSPGRTTCARSCSAARAAGSPTSTSTGCAWTRCTRCTTSAR